MFYAWFFLNPVIVFLQLLKLNFQQTGSSLFLLFSAGNYFINQYYIYEKDFLSGFIAHRSFYSAGRNRM